jgi:hypothetical protein
MSQHLQVPITTKTSHCILLLILALPAMGAEKCPHDPDLPATITRTQIQAFAALKQQDRASWNDIVSPDFVAFEGGHRFDRSALFEVVTAARAAGKHYEWSVTDAHIEASCTIATVYYVNRGSITEAQSSAPVSWLETATFRHTLGKWHLVFLESMREAR